MTQPLRRALTPPPRDGPRAGDRRVAVVPRDSAATRARGDTRVFAVVPAPGYPAYVHVHTNGRVYAGSYVDSGSTAPSKVFEWSAAGKLLRSWVVPGQVLDEDHGVQVANQTHDGKLVLLETSTASILTLDLTTGRFQRRRPLPRRQPCPTTRPGARRRALRDRLRAGRDLEGAARLAYADALVQLAGARRRRVRHHRHPLPAAAPATC